MANPGRTLAPGIRAEGRWVRAQAPKFAGSKSNHRENFERYDDAVRWRAAALRAVKAGEPLPDADDFRTPMVPTAEAATDQAPAAVFTVAEVAWMYWVEWLQTHPLVGYRWINQYQARITKYVVGMLGNWKISDVDRAKAFEISNELALAGLQGRTSGTFLAAFVNVFEYAVYVGLIAVNPFRGVPAQEPHPDNVLDPYAGIETPYQSLADTKKLADCLGAVFAAVAWFQRLVGLRVSEAMGIRLGDIEWATGWLSVRGQAGATYHERDKHREWKKNHRKNNLKTHAGKRDIVIPMTLLLQLRRLVLAVYGLDPIDGGFDPTAPLLVAKPGARPSLSSYYKAYAKARKALGMAPVDVGHRRSGHDDRAFANTDVTEDKVVPELVRDQFMGHAPYIAPGMAKVNRKYQRYKDRNPKMQLIADYFDREIHGQLGDDVILIGDLNGPLVDYPSFSIREFGDLLNMSYSGAHGWVTKGVIRSERHEMANGVTRYVLRASDVYEFIEARSEIWTARRAATMFQVPIDTVRHWLREDQVKGTKLPNETWIINIDSFHQRLASWRTLNDGGLSLTEAGALLNMPVDGVSHLLETGDLRQAGCDTMKRPRVTYQSVMAYRDKVLGARASMRTKKGLSRKVLG